MEMKKLFTKTRMIVLMTALLCMVCLLFTGCNTKYWWEYEDAWVSEDPYIYISTQNSSESHYCEIEINGEIVAADSSWANNGTGICFYTPTDKDWSSDDEIIWETSVKIKNGKMYLTVDVDNYGDNEGQTFVLEQQDLS